MSGGGGGSDPLLELARDLRDYVGLLDRCGMRHLVPAGELVAAAVSPSPVVPRDAPPLIADPSPPDEQEAAPTPPAEAADPAHEPLVAGVGNDFAEEIPPPPPTSTPEPTPPSSTIQSDSPEAAAEPDAPRDAEGQLDLFAVMEEPDAYQLPPRAAESTAPRPAPPSPTAAPPAPEPPAPAVPPSIALPRADRIAALEAMARTVAACRLCALSEGRTQTVFGEGDPEARLMFIGEGPGYNEDQQGRPFVGRAGQLLDKMIVAMGLSRPQVYIANAVKCRPPNNRTPTPDECAACEPYLRRQIELIRPGVICLLGATASKLILRTNAPMYAMRGHWHAYEGIPVRVTYHPAYLLRTPGDKTKAWDDLQVVMERLGLTPPQAPRT